MKRTIVLIVGLVFTISHAQAYSFDPYTDGGHETYDECMVKAHMEWVEDIGEGAVAGAAGGAAAGSECGLPGIVGGAIVGGAVAALCQAWASSDEYAQALAKCRALYQPVD